MRYTDADRLQLIVRYGERLLALKDELDLSAESLNADYRLQWLITTPLYNIGEQAYGLSETFVEEHADVPWQMIAAFRHRLVHDYEGTNWTLVASILDEEIAPLVDEAKRILDDWGISTGDDAGNSIPSQDE